MSKITNENDEMIEKKLEYIGLNLEKIPTFLKEFEPLNFRPLKSYDDIIYKVYQYIDIKKIEILITPTDRLTELKEKYKLARPLYMYLDSKNEENIDKFATFLEMLSNMDIQRIEQIEEEQEKLKEKIPYKVKYPNHYIWQIYYSDYAQKYFMLVPTNEQDNSELFYLLKKQIQARKSRKKEVVFAPITHLDYSGQFLTKAEIEDIENYLWYFTKEWASVYEVYDLKNKMSIRIVGTTPVYEKIKSNYCITLNSKDEAITFYKLLKAMFILATGASEEYKFTSKITEDGTLAFYYKEKQVVYEELSEFINHEHSEKIDRIKKEISETTKLRRRLKRFNNLVEELTQEYLAKQRQIATFLECKKTFFGKVKYFFKKKKEEPIVTKKESLRDKEEIREAEERKNLYEEKTQYTIEDLINICTKLQEKQKENTNLNIDIKAIENKKDILAKKIENAEMYIKEIDSHKKSIFEFWKYTSKDEVQTLNEGEAQDEEKRDKIAKFFNYETDLEDLGKIVDEIQRRKLSKNETDAIFAIRHATNSMREMIKEKYSGELENIKINETIIEKELEKLKEEYTENLDYITIKDIDIFGGLSEDKTKIKLIHNQKHREIEKDKYKILNANLDTSIEIYKDTIRNYVNLIVEAFNKITTPYNMAVYRISNKKKVEGIEIFNINPQDEIQKVMDSKKEKITLCRVNMKENMPIIFYSNITFFDNFNKTLPVGMDLSSEVLINFNKIKAAGPKEKSFYMNFAVNEFEMDTKLIQVYEYTAEEKTEEK